MQHALDVSLGHKLTQYYVLTKPRVTQLAVFCAVIGMFLAVPGLPPIGRVVAATIGIWLLASAAFAVNCLVGTPSSMRAWRGRPVAPRRRAN